MEFCEDEYDDEETEFSSSPFQEDLREYGMSCIRDFFEDKRMHCGGKIPKTLLFTEKRILDIFNLDIIQAVDIVYKAIDDSLEKLESIELVNESLRFLSKSGIPKYFAGGILIMYLEFCEGIDFG